ncbi:PadR family transcriptional regulator [Vibrio rumoiensis]|uniref:Transcriptional regulator n=1 Tax=Vibrio rumoiensis 1S-45 TaxID=1188252 RepID=A0A1E5E6D7_9VIBR|nr:PadR family transcriptional regulator [Vibrio rumoiensis]OEF30052.1 transcriptional regulator [Vibrio rumoiensis 1S-45]
MSLPHVILTILSRHEATGYDITKAFSQNIGHFWKASHQQVYRELNKMSQLEWVTSELIIQEGKPDKKIYTITDLGRKALLTWFEQPTPYTATRDEFSAKLMACTVQSTALMIEQINDLIPQAETMIQQFQLIEKQCYAYPDKLNIQARLERLILRRNILERKMWVEWATEVKEQLTLTDSLI